MKPKIFEASFEFLGANFSFLILFFAVRLSQGGCEQ